ncbi:DENN domain-containing protein 1B-like [Planococcus citri]|uniref:DENN domain-containing protein 1B-like n=1 Tax=Planococcus citri TaxID=170843 RepID=UPI0031F79721
MGSRLRQDVKHFFECFCEVVGPKGDQNKAWIIQKFPETYKDEAVLKLVPEFAFPCEFDRKIMQHYSFVLTNVDSKWTFGFCRHDPASETALVILTYLPWHEAFSKFLNYISELTQGPHSDQLWKFLDGVYQHKIPRTGFDLSISINPSMKAFICEAPRPFTLPSIPENRNLTEYYNAVDIRNMMVIFASMLCERRIIFTSKKLSRLSACVQSANALLYPMNWQHIFIPVLPKSLIEYLLAPMPYLIGLPHSLLQHVRFSDLGDVVMLDADNNTIDSPFHDLESLPSDVVHNLRKQLSNRASLLGDGVSKAFLRALVQLIGGYRDALKISQGKKITFSNEAFVESRPPSIQPFLRKMLELQIFQQFIEERLDLLNAGLGFSDEFELEVCNHCDKSSSKMQQYRDWLHIKKKEGTVIFKTIIKRANPAMKSAVNSVKERGKDMRSVYKEFRSKLKDTKKDKPNSAPSSPTMVRAHFPALDSKHNSSSGTIDDKSQFHLLEKPNSSSPGSDDDFSPMNMDLMGDLQDVIFRNFYTISSESDGASPSLKKPKLPVDKSHEYPRLQKNTKTYSDDTDSVFKSFHEPLQSSSSESKFHMNEPQDLIRLDSSSSISDFDPLSTSTGQPALSPTVGVINPLYPYYYPEKKQSQKDSELLSEYGIDFHRLALPASNESSDVTDFQNVVKTKSEWTKFE